jgi:hypothetical protein
LSLRPHVVGSRWRLGTSCVWFPERPSCRRCELTRPSSFADRVLLAHVTWAKPTRNARMANGPWKNPMGPLSKI